MSNNIESFVKSLVESPICSGVENKIQTENGEWVMDTSNHPGIDAFHKIVRTPTTRKTGWRNESDEAKTNIHKYISNMLQTANNKWNETHDPTALEYIIDAFLLAAHKRAVKRTYMKPTSNTSTTTNESNQTANKLNDGDDKKNSMGGEGERMIFARMIIELYNEYPQTVSCLIPLIPDLGCWQDLYMIWSLAVTNPGNAVNIAMPIIKCIVRQLISDFQKLDDPTEHINISLITKWVAREGSYWDKKCYITNSNPPLDGSNPKKKPELIHSYTILTVVYNLAISPAGITAVEGLETFDDIRQLCKIPSINAHKKTLRKLISRTCAIIDVFEQKACAKKWSTIKPNNVPSRAMSKYSKAFLNEKIKQSPSALEMVTGNRYPNDVDRVTARTNLITFMQNSNTFKTDGLDPHEIINNYKRAKSSTEREIIFKQLQSKIDAIYNEIMASATSDGTTSATSDTIVSKKTVLVPMMDVSGSMSGLPMDVSIGLGIFLTYLQEKMGTSPFAISFTDIPMAFNFTGLSLSERIDLVNGHVGLSTNFWAAIELVLDAMVKSGNEMDLIVFTDMQWDCANQEKIDQNESRGTIHQRILNRVVELGLKTAPRIIYWNLRSNTPGIQTDATQEGVQFLQGYSASLLRFALLGENIPEKIVTLKDGTNIKVKSITPYETYRKALDNPRFNKWLQIILDSNEGLLAHTDTHSHTHNDA